MDGSWALLDVTLSKLVLLAANCSQTRSLIYRDEEMIKRLEEESHKAVEEIDSYVAMAKMQISGELLGICNGAIELIDEIRNPEPEIF